MKLNKCKSLKSTFGSRVLSLIYLSSTFRHPTDRHRHENKTLFPKRVKRET